MRLAAVHIEGYRSIKAPLDLVVDEHVTVVLGANDHGKSNLLSALLHLNADNPCTEDDLNWDCETEPQQLPYVRFEFALSDEDSKELADMHNGFLARDLIAEFQKTTRTGLATARRELGASDNEVSSATQSVTEAEATLDELTADAATTQKDRNAAKAAVRQAKKQFDANVAARDEVQARVDQLETSLTLAAARMIEAEARIDGEAREPALAGAAREVARKVSQARAASKQAKQRRSEAEAERTAAESQSVTSEQLAALDAALDSAKQGVVRADAALDSEKARQAELRRGFDLVAKANAGEKELVRLDAPAAPPADPTSMPETAALQRRGVNGPREPEAIDGIDAAALAAFLDRRVPIVELIQPFDRIPDAVTRKQLDGDDEYIFMRGIFHYAGLGPDEWDKIFTQSDRTTRRLEDASEHLDKTLKKSWSQGSKLKFKLDHDSAKKTIELLIKDPAVAEKFVRASRRSSGFTHFFALKTILHAFESESPSASYLWLFDEPGIYLHPDGQFDLIQVMETLAQANQAIYTTHSIFMANKNYPVRHGSCTRTPMARSSTASPSGVGGSQRSTTSAYR